MNKKIFLLIIALLFTLPLMHLVSCNTIEGNVEQGMDNFSTGTVTYKLSSFHTMDKKKEVKKTGLSAHLQ